MRCQSNGPMSLGQKKNLSNLDENFREAKEHSPWSPQIFSRPNSVKWQRY